MLGRIGQQRRGVQAAGQGHPHKEAALGLGGRDSLGEELLDGLAHGAGPLAVGIANGGHLSGQPAASHELVGHGLGQGAAVQVGALFGHHELVGQLGRADHPGQSQTRRQRLAKGAEIDDVAPRIALRGGVLGIAGRVDGQERGQRLAGKAQLTIGIVLHQADAVARGDVDHLSAASYGHRDAGGILKGGQ